MKGYKVFNPDWTCRDMQFEVGKSYEMEEEPVVCKRGFHFCEKIVDCFEYYGFYSNNKVAEIEAFGELDFEESGNKHCTNKIKIIRELTWYEVLELVNTGKDCTGRNNSGDSNTGNRNTGDSNSGDSNTGDSNSGDSNTGNWNTGNNNTGNNNTGNWNTGNRNSGDCNTGNRNSGNNNTGNNNTGNRNTGDNNTGNWNTGDNNTGNRNTGDRNTGDCNTGDWNLASNCAGCFNTISQPIMFFDNPANITFQQWRNSKACLLLRKIEFRPTEWICSNNMSDVEKERHPEHETTGGYLKIGDNSECYLEWWEGLTDCEKEIIKAIPNFDNEKFYQITGIKVE